MSLALATLIYEWRRYLAAILALAFCSLLVIALIGLFLGMARAFTATIDRSPADIMILSAKSESLLDDSGGLPRRLKPTIFLHPEVMAVDEMAGNGGRFQNIPKPGEKQKEDFVSIWGVDPLPGSATLPTDFSEETRRALLVPYTVAVDRTSLKSLGVQLGDKALLNAKTVTIGAVLDGYPNMMDTTIVTSRDTMRMLGMRGNPVRTGPLMVRIRNPARAEQVRDELNAQAKGAYRAWTREELGKANEASMMGEAIIAIIMGFVVVLGVVIGVVITSQTLRGAVLSSIKEFASLRALGVGMGSLRLIVIELSFWIGVVGLLIAGGLVFGVSLLASQFALPLSLPLWVISTSAVALMIIALFSGALALGILKKSQPADLLR